MADVTMTVNPQKITNSADTNDHTIDISKFVNSASKRAVALIDNISGPMQYNGKDVVQTISASYTTTDKVVIDVERHLLFHFKGASGSETFQIAIVNES